MTPDEEMTLLHYARVATGFAWNKQVPTQYKTDHPRCVFCCSEEDHHNDPWEGDMAGRYIAQRELHLDAIEAATLVKSPGMPKSAACWRVHREARRPSQESFRRSAKVSSRSTRSRARDTYRPGGDLRSPSGIPRQDAAGLLGFSLRTRSKTPFMKTCGLLVSKEMKNIESEAKDPAAVVFKDLRRGRRR
jgi:hypothetical protein